MTTHHWPGVAFLLGVLALGASMSGEPQNPLPPRDARPQPTQPPRDPAGATQTVAVGKGGISGKVVIASTGQPARRARVNLTSPEGGGSRTAMTDDLGAFSFTALPAGRYSLSAAKPGYINGAYGQRIPGRSGTPIQLAEGQRLQVQVQIWRGGVITGTILDEHGEAIPNTPVRALRYVLQGGQRTLQQTGNAQTDDRGVYRIFGLQPGEYLVSATPRNINNQPALAERAAMESVAQRIAAVSARGAAPQAQALIERLAEMKAEMATVTADDEQSTGYAPVYYPGTTSIANAAAIAVGPAEEKSGVDFQYQVVPVARIEGIVTSSAVQLPSNVQITLVGAGYNSPGLNQGARADAQGTFRLQNVAPGQYTLIARATIGAGREGAGAQRGLPLGGRGEAFAGRGRGAAPLQDATRLWASTEVTVDGRNITNVVLTLQPGVPVTGRITFDGTTQQPPTDLTRMRVSLQPIPSPGSSGEMLMPAPGRVEADGRFTITSVIPGRYRLTGSGAGAGWVLGSSMIEGQDSLDFPVEVKSAVTGAMLTFVDRQSELSGTITNDQSQPVPDYTLILYPADQRYRTPQSRRIQTSRPATDGRFTFRNVPPGDYRLAPVLDPEPGVWFDPGFLQQLDNGAIRISIGEAEKKEQNLRVPGGA
jgi:protocatechuate 3,4-dioxygenase beta subunit